MNIMEKIWQALCNRPCCSFCLCEIDTMAEYSVPVGVAQVHMLICSECWVQVVRGCTAGWTQWRVGTGWIMLLPYGLEYFDRIDVKESAAAGLADPYGSP